MARIKLLQIHTFYDAYLKTFYCDHKEITSASFKEQIAQIFDQGYARIHLLTPELCEQNYDAELIVANAYPTQLKWVQEQNSFFSGSGQDRLYDIVKEQIETFKPDVLYLTDPVTFDSLFLKQLSWRPSLVIGWRAAPIPENTDWSLFDLILSHLTVSLETAKERGANAVEYFYPGFSIDLVDRVKNELKVFDVVFSGQWSQLHSVRNSYLTKLLQSKGALHNAPVIAYFLLVESGVESLPEEVKRVCKDALWGMDMYRGLKSGKIVINAEIDMAGGEAGNMRLFEATGVGSFLLTEFHDNISSYFKPGIEIETFKSSEELIDKTRFYLENDTLREKIAREGQKRCLQDYSLQRRAASLDEIIKRYLR